MLNAIPLAIFLEPIEMAVGRVPTGAIIRSADAISNASLTLKRFCVIRNVQGNALVALLLVVVP